VVIVFGDSGESAESYAAICIGTDGDDQQPARDIDDADYDSGISGICNTLGNDGQRRDTGCFQGLYNILKLIYV